jgi:predicted dehydrogenase
MDWIGHHNDIAHWAMDLDESGPTRVEAVGWEFPATSVYNTPWHYTVRSEYENGVVSTISDQNKLGVTFHGSSGWLHVTRGKLTASNEEWTRPGFDVGKHALPPSPGHMHNFIDCVRSKSQCVAPAASAHRSITPGHLGYVSNALERAVQWDTKTQTIVNDPEADQLLRHCPYRQPWSLEVSTG